MIARRNSPAAGVVAASMSGVIVLAVALLAATAFGVWRKWRDGRVRGSAGSAPVVNPEELPAPLGQRATLLQFSSEFCQPCRATRAVLSRIAADEPGIAHIEVDAAEHLDMVQRLDVTRTPTVLILDQHGHETGRSVGAARPAEIRAALGVMG